MKMLSLSDLAAKLGESIHVVNHALRRYGPEPIGRLGMARFWDPSQLPDIQASLRRTAERSTNKARRTCKGAARKVASRTRS